MIKDTDQTKILQASRIRQMQIRAQPPSPPWSSRRQKAQPKDGGEESPAGPDHRESSEEQQIEAAVGSGAARRKGDPSTAGGDYYVQEQDYGASQQSSAAGEEVNVNINCQLNSTLYIEKKINEYSNESLRTKLGCELELDSSPSLSKIGDKISMLE